MIPPDKSAAVDRALAATFATTAVEDIREMPKGLSSDLVFRLVINGAPYLLRLMTRINESMDPSRIFACMQITADAGLAPAVRYSSAEQGISITDFVEAKPFRIAEALTQVPAALRQLHALSPFPKTFNYVTAHNGFIWRFRDADLLPENEIEAVFTRYCQLCATYPRCDADLVSCHNDLKPETIIFDGQRLWLAGWQAAMVNDRYFDLAIAANFLAAEDDTAERAYLARYFGQPPDEYQRARFFLMRQVLHMLSATVFLTLGAAGKPIPAHGGQPPSLSSFYQRLWHGEIDLAGHEAKIACGRLHWEQLVENMQSPRFAEALEIVSAPNRTQPLEPVRLLLPSAPLRTPI